MTSPHPDAPTGKCLNDGRECGGCVDCGNYKPPAPTGDGWEATPQEVHAAESVTGYVCRCTGHVCATCRTAQLLASQRKALTEGAVKIAEKHSWCDHEAQQTHDCAHETHEALKSFFTQTTL